MRIKLSLILVLMFPVASLAAGWQPLGAVTAVQSLSNGVELRAGGGALRITALSPSVVRVRYALSGNFPPDQSWAVVEKTGLVAPEIRVHDAGDAIDFTTAAMRIRVEKADARVIFLNLAGDVILQDHAEHPPAWDGAAFRVWKTMPENEHYFGLGDKAGPLDHRNMAFTMWNTDYYGWQESSDPLYKSIPFFLGFRQRAAYGLFLDNTWRTWFDFGKEARDYFSFGAEGGELNYYFFYGPEPKKVVADYTALTGHTPLPPLVTLGYQQCRYSYYPEARVREIAREFRARKIPADVIYLDIDYQQDNRPFTINRERFPAFEQMIRDLGQDGFKVVAITDLHLAALPGYQPYDEGLARDLFVHNPDGTVYQGKVWPGDSVFPDFTWAPAREWWGTLYKDFVNMGIRGFWNDMNEPAVFTHPSKTIPVDVVGRVDGRRTATQREVHNVFGMQNVRATYEGLLRLRPDQRPFVLTRAAYAGAQRFAASWTGDNSSMWNHYRMSVPTLLSLGISGYGFVGDDIGGFAGTPPADLLTRWMELGAFNPIYRNHTEKGSGDQEPWVHGPEHEAIRRRYIELRYKLLPYLYTSMEEMSRTGVPLMRPMFLEFPDDPSLETNDREFMFGGALLVAPKLTEMLDPINVRLPAGVWYDYWIGSRLEGGRDVKADPALDVLPLFVRGGSVIPHQAVIQSVSEKPLGPLELRVYPGPNCRGTVYSDDGDTLAYQRGAFQRTTVTCAADGSQVQIAAPEGTYKPWWTTFQVTIVGVDRAPRRVTVAGTVSNFKYDANQKSLAVNTPAGKQIEIAVQY
jgi:alpha-glucosidase